MIFRSRGPYQSVKYIKLVRTQLLALLAESQEPPVRGVKVTKDGIPMVLRDLAPQIRQLKSREIHIFTVWLQILGTILFASRSLRVGKDVDLQPIIAPFDRSISLLKEDFDFGKYISDFWRDLGYVPR